MVKFIGLVLLVSSLLSLIAGAFIDLRYSTSISTTGNVILNILTQTPISMNLIDYIAAAAFSYSILSLIIGLVFLFRV